MVLADDDLHVHAHFARPAENFDHAAGWRDAALRESSELHIHDGAIQLGQPRALQRGGKFGIAGAEFLAKLFAELGREFQAGGNDDFVQDASVVGQHDVAIRAIAEQADDGGMLALDDLHDTAFGTAVSAAAFDAGENFVAVHGVAQAIAPDEEVAFDTWDRRVRNQKTVAVAMCDQPAGNEVGIAAAFRFLSTRRFFVGSDFPCWEGWREQQRQCARGFFERCERSSHFWLVWLQRCGTGLLLLLRLDDASQACSGRAEDSDVRYGGGPCRGRFLECWRAGRAWRDTARLRRD